MPKETYIPSLFALFRQYGYDGATLSKISEATGLGKASLYHHFPGGKDEMVESVVEYAETWLQDNILHALSSEGSALERLQTMCDRVNDLYAGGTKPCLMAILQSGTGQGRVHDQVKGLLETWIGAIAHTLVEAGIKPETAQQRGEDAIVAIQGALMLSQGLDNPAIFQRRIQTLPPDLLRPDG